MDELTRKAHAAADRWIATLTPEQRALAKVGALKPEHMTPHQQKLCEEISNYIPKGMNTEQIREWGRITTLEENREKFQSEFRRGWNDADKQINKVKWICFALGCCIAILILLRC